jgi:hypothetical protein
MPDIGVNGAFGVLHTGTANSRTCTKLLHRPPTQARARSAPLASFLQSMSRSFRAAAAAILIVGLSACGDEVTAPATPASIEIVAPAPQSGTVGTVVSVAPTFVVKNDRGEAMRDVAVTITVSAGGGSLANAPTRASETTSVGQWTLGTSAGINRLTIAVAGLDPTAAISATVSVTAVAGPPVAMAITSGGGQARRAGAAAAAVTLLVTDQYGNGVPNQPVTFAVAAGGGSLASTAATSAAGGVVTAPVWTLGKSAVPQTLRASFGALVADVNATIATDFKIDVRFYGPPMTPAQQAIFTDAAARLSAIITGDVGDAEAFGINVAEYCGVSGLPILNETIDDVVIYASVQSIDGPGDVLAQAGPCAFRFASQGGLPVIGMMEFDSADLASMAGNGTLQDVITHEMLHVLGMGTLWQGHLSGFNTPSVSYIGALAVQGCRDTGATSTCALSVPVENSGGSGTANSHWRETTFRSELMTGYVSSGGMPLSLLTIGSLADLGYQVNRDAADLYIFSVSGGALSSLTTGDAPVWERRPPGTGGTLPPKTPR